MVLLRHARKVLAGHTGRFHWKQRNTLLSANLRCRRQAALARNRFWFLINQHNRYFDLFSGRSGRLRRFAASMRCDALRQMGGDGVFFTNSPIQAYSLGKPACPHTAQAPRCALGLTIPKPSQAGSSAARWARMFAARPTPADESALHSQTRTDAAGPTIA